MLLREARRQRGLTQEQLADLSGVDQATISDIERGKSQSPSWETVGRLARAIGVDPHSLFPLDPNVADEHPISHDNLAANASAKEV